MSMCGEGAGLDGGRSVRQASDGKLRRLLWVSHHSVFCGPLNNALRLSKLTLALGWEIVTAIPNEGGGAAERLREAGVQVFEIPLHRIRKRLDPRLHVAFAAHFASDIQVLRSLIREQRIDAVMTEGYYNPHAALAARREGVSSIWQIAGTEVWLPLRPLVARAISRVSDVMMFTGDVLKRMYVPRESFGVPTFSFYPPVDTEVFAPSGERRTATRRLLGIDEKAPVVGAVLNIRPAKGVEFFVEAAARIHRKRPDCYFLVVGATLPAHAEYAARIADQVAHSGIPRAQFIFAGARADIHNYYPAMDVKLLTSRADGVPTTCLEALASGVPVVAFDVGAVPEIIDHGENGFVIGSRDTGAAADAVLSLLNDRERLLRFSESARRRAVERFDARICAAVYVRAFNAGVERSRRNTIVGRIPDGEGSYSS